MVWHWACGVPASVPGFLDSGSSVIAVLHTVAVVTRKERPSCAGFLASGSSWNALVWTVGVTRYRVCTQTFVPWPQSHRHAHLGHNHEHDQCVSVSVSSPTCEQEVMFDPCFEAITYFCSSSHPNPGLSCCCPSSDPNPGLSFCCPSSDPNLGLFQTKHPQGVPLKLCNLGFARGTCITALRHVHLSCTASSWWCAGDMDLHILYSLHESLCPAQPVECASKCVPCCELLHQLVP